MIHIANVVTRGLRFVKRRGMRGVLEKLHLAKKKTEFLKHYAFLMQQERVPLDRDAFEKHKDDGIKLLNWVIPEMGEGSGGHMTIFRFASLLEDMGFHSRLYLVLAPSFRNDNKGLRNVLAKKFKILDPRVEAFWDISEAGFAHATIATSWETAYFVKNFDNTVSKFYFVQDYEPYFFPRGAYYQFAEDTYRFGFRRITAGEWLKEVLEEKYAMPCDSFLFSYDRKYYRLHEKTALSKKVFFYVRPVTPRRDFEIGMMALCELCKRMPEVEVIFAGWDVNDVEIPFRHRNMKIIGFKELSDIYGECDLCLVLSNTNLSLLPLEIMASGSVAVCSGGPQSEWLVNENNSILVKFDPLDIADKMEYYLKHPDELMEIREKGIAFAQQTSWEKEARKVRDALGKGIREDLVKTQGSKGVTGKCLDLTGKNGKSGN